jgi:hypothetical protein
MTMLPFIQGMTSALCFVAALFFIKFWVGSKERLLLLFGIAFGILGADWLVLGVLPSFSPRATEHNALVYSVRLLAFLIILAAITDKNRRRSKGVASATLPSKHG